MTLEQWAILLPALIYVESRGNPSAVGDNGKAIGILQIHQCVVEDVNRIYHRSFRWPADCRSEWASVTMAILYLCRYAGAEGSPEKWARIWNGGPTGHRNTATLQYWHKVRDAMQTGG